jgi:hypothetical protein
MSFRGAVLILSSATERHLLQDNLVSKTTLVSWVFLSLIYSFNSPLGR